MALFWGALLLAAPLQCKDHPTFMAFGLKDQPGRLAISVWDFAQFGLLYLREGDWKGEQRISQKHVEAAVTGAPPNSTPQAVFEVAEIIKGQRTVGSGLIPDTQTDHFGS